MKKKNYLTAMCASVGSLSSKHYVEQQFRLDEFVFFRQYNYCYYFCLYDKTTYY